MRRAWLGFGLVLAGMGGSLFTFGMAFGQAEIDTDNEAAHAAPASADDYEICPYRRCHGFNPSRPYVVDETEWADSGESGVPAANAEASTDWEWDTYQRWYEGRWYRDSFVLRGEEPQEEAQEEAPAESNLAETQADDAPESDIASDLVSEEPMSEEVYEPSTPSEEALVPDSEEAIPASEEPEAVQPEEAELPQAAQPKDIYSEEYYELPGDTEFADESNDEPMVEDTDGDDADDEGEGWWGDDEEGADEGDDESEDYVPADEGTEPAAEEPAIEEGAAAPEAAEPQDIYSENYRTEEEYRAADEQFEPAPVDPAPVTEETTPETAPQPEATEVSPEAEATEVSPEAEATEVSPEAEAAPEYNPESDYVPQEEPTPEATPEAAGEPSTEATPAEVVPGYQDDYVPDYSSETPAPAAEEAAPAVDETAPAVEEAAPAAEEAAPAAEDSLPTEQEDIQNRQGEESLPAEGYEAPQSFEGNEPESNDYLPNEHAPETQLDSGIDGSFLQLRDVIGDVGPDAVALGMHWIQLHETCSAVVADAMVKGQEFFRPVADSIREQLATLAPMVRGEGDRSIDSAASEAAYGYAEASESAESAGLLEGLEVSPLEPVASQMTAEEIDIARRTLLLEMGEALDHFATLLNDISAQLINEAYSVREPDLSTAELDADSTR